MRAGGLVARMRFILLVSLFLVGCASDRHLIDKPFFYEVSKGSQHGVLLGTVREGVSIDELPEAVQESFRSADVLVQESKYGNVDISDRYSPSNATPIQSLLSPVEYKATVDWLNAGFTSERVRTILEEESPVGIAEKLSIVRLCKNNYSECRSMKFWQSKPMESQFHSQLGARDSFYLSTNEAAMKAHRCLSWSDEQTLANIRTTLTGGNPLIEDFARWDALEEAYRSGDTSRVATAASAFASPEIYKCVVTDRTPDWIPEIDSALTRYHAPFITVSIAHIATVPGAKSLLDLLTENGYSVKRVEFDKIRHAH